MKNFGFGTLDTEWVSLILEAKKIGISQQEIREFLYSKRKN